jgi:flagellar protein FliO/FliZ
MPAPRRGRRPRHSISWVALGVLVLASSARAESPALEPVDQNVVNMRTHPFPRRGGARGSDTEAKVEATGGWWRGTAAVALALAAAGWGSLAARRYWPHAKFGLIPGAPATPLRVVGRASLSPRHSVYLLEAGGRVLIVGTGPQTAPSLLGELTDSDAPARLDTLVGDDDA